MNDKLDSLQKGLSAENQTTLLQNELQRAAALYSSIPSSKKISSLKIGKPLDKSSYDQSKKFLTDLRKQLINDYKSASARKDGITQKIISENKDPEYLFKLKSDYTNESLDDLVVSTADFNFVIDDGDQLVRRFRPVLMDGPHDSFVRSQFFVSGKNVFGNYFSTYSVNLAVIWSMSILLMVTLYNNSLNKFLKFSESLFQKIKFRKNS